MNTKAGARLTLGFPDRVRSAFSFLHDFGIEEISSEPTIVRYASGKVYLNVYHGRSSYEVGIEIGLHNAEEPGHGLSSLVRLVDPVAGARYRNPVALTAEDLVTGLAEVAKTLTSYGQDVLRGDSVTLEALSRQRKDWAQSYAAEIEYRNTAPLAAEAFQRKDYKTAARLYERIIEMLSPSELKKLDYARAHQES